MLTRERGGQAYDLTTIPVSKNPEVIALSPDGRQVWTVPYGDSCVVIIDTSTGTVIWRVPLPTRQINSLRFTPTENASSSRMLARVILSFSTRPRATRSSG